MGSFPRHATMVVLGGCTPCYKKVPPVSLEVFKRVIVTPAVYPSLVGFLHFDIQSTGQKSQFVFTLWDLRIAMF
jgi:hypothetical protein